MSGRDPASDHRPPIVHPLLKRRLEEVLYLRRAAQDLSSKDSRSLRPIAGEIHLGADVAAKRFGGVTVRPKTFGGEPGFEDALQNAPVEGRLGGEIIMQVGFRQAGPGSDFGRRRTVEAPFGKNFFGRREDAVFVSRSNG